MQTIDRFNKMVAAGNIKRFHTQPMVHDRNVAHHTFNMLLIADYAYDGEVPSTISQAILYHDLHEIYMGDIPYPIKQNNPHLKEAIKATTENIEREMQIIVRLCKEDENILKYIDMLELVLHLVQEKLLGNKQNSAIMDRATAALDDIPSKPNITWYNLDQLKKHLLET